MGSRRSKQSKRRSARAAARTHLGRLARASPPLASCSHQPPSPPSSPTPTCTQHTAAAQDSIQETPTDPRGESAAQRSVKRTRRRRRRRRRIGRPVDPAETRRRCLTDAGALGRRGRSARSHGAPLNPSPAAGARWPGAQHPGGLSSPATPPRSRGSMLRRQATRCPCTRPPRREGMPTSPGTMGGGSSSGWASPRTCFGPRGPSAVSPHRSCTPFPPTAIALPIWKREEGDGEKRDRYREGRGEIPGFDRSFLCVPFCGRSAGGRWRAATLNMSRWI